FRFKLGGGIEARQVRGLDVRVRLRDGKLNALVGADRASKDHALAGIFGSALDEPVPIADGLGGDENALRVPAVYDVAEPHALLTEQAVGWNLHVVEENSVGVMVDHQVKRLDIEFALHGAHVHDENR